MISAVDPVIALCLVIMAFAAASAWWVTRPFERARREQERAGPHAAE